MTIINAKDLDQQMGRSIDPNSVPKHDGADRGIIQETDQSIVERGGGRRGAAVFNEQEVGGQDFFGSKTIISVNDAPPIQEEHDPRLQAAKKVAAVAPPMPTPPPAPVAPPRPRSPEDVLKAMGLFKPKA